MHTSPRPPQVVSRFFAIVSLAAALGLAACGGDGTEPGEPPEPAGALTSATCAQFARAGKVDICHASESGGDAFKALSVSQQACSSEHADHLEDFVASPESGCKLAKPGRCKPAGSACSPSRAAECCSLSCIFPLGAKKPVCG